ncbi:MAG: TetR family transcriptional regulator [Thermoleophilia bacterium]|nr:TetR family transcriptional regulator [Thermoleophilia bacterium]
MTGGERREQIICAARQEFARSGYHGASTASIARAAGCSEPMLYKHFAGKQALFTAVLELVAGTIERAFDEMLDAPGNLIDHWNERLPTVMADPAYVEMLQLRTLAVTALDEPAVRDLLVQQQDRHRSRVATAIARAKEEGWVREDIESEDVAWGWTGLMLAGCYREALQPGGFAAMLPHVQAFVDSLSPM